MLLLSGEKLMTNSDRMTFIVELSLGTYPIVLGLGYVWVRAMHYPFTIRQHKMWTYYVLFTSAFPVLAPLCVALGLWVMPPRQSAEISIVALIAWMAASFYIVRWMSKPGGRLSQERRESD